MRNVRSVISAVTPGLPSRSPPIQLPSRRNGPTRGGRVPVRPVSAAGPGARPGRRIERRIERPVEPRDDGEQRGVEEGHRRPHLVERGRADDAQVRGPPQERDLLAQPAPDLAVLGRGQARVVRARQQDRAAAQSATSVVRRRASVGCAVRTGETSSRAISASSSASFRPRRRSPATASATESGEDPVACRALAPAQRPDPAARLGQVDQPEVEREGADDGLRRPEVEAAAAPRRDARARSDRRARRSAIVRFRIRSTSANSSGPACSAMTWPSSAPSSRTSTASGSRAPAVPIPSGSAATAGVTPPARRDPVTRPIARDRSGPIRHRTATFLAATFLYACMVMPMTSIGSASAPARAAGREARRA